jgi:hypothetical protein
MTLFVNVFIFLLPNSFCFETFVTYSFNGCKVSCEITKHNSTLFEVPQKCFLILVIDAILNSFAQNLHFSSQELPCLIGGVIHSTNVHSSALEGGHGVVCFLETEEQLLGVEKELLKDIFTKQLTVESHGGKLNVLKVVAIKNCNYNMKHRRSGGPRHIA